MVETDVKRQISRQVDKLSNSNVLLFQVLDFVNQLVEQQKVVENAYTHLNSKTKKSFALLYKLQDNWDGYGAPKISTVAIDNCKNIVCNISTQIFDNIQILPTEIGGVQIVYQPNPSERLSCNIGDSELSYYTKRKDKKPFFSPFLQCNEDNFKTIADNINNFYNDWANLK